MVAKRQGREKHKKIEQRKVKGRSKDRIKDLRKNKQHSWLSPICIGQAQGEEKKHIKGEAKVRSFSLSLSPQWACILSLSLSLSLRSFSLSLSLSFFLSLSPSPVRWSTLPLSSLRVFGLACPHTLRMDSPAIF